MLITMENSGIFFRFTLFHDVIVRLAITLLLNGHNIIVTYKDIPYLDIVC